MLIVSENALASNTYQFVLPATFDPRDVLPLSLKKRRDDARYLVATILRKIAHGDTDERGMVVLAGKYLRRIMQADDYKRVIDVLISEGVITRDFYTVGGKSYGYAIGDQFRDVARIRVGVTDRRLIRALQRFQEERKRLQLQRYSPVHFHLAGKQYQLGIDAKKACEVLKELPPSERTRVSPFDSQSILIKDLADRRFHFSVGQYGRVSNSITNMSRHVRPTLHFDGRPLRHLDIRCCQPALLGRLVREEQDKGTETIIYDAENDPSPGLVDRSNGRAKSSTEHYIGLVQSGEFYDFMQTKLEEMTRDQIKKRFLTDVIAKKRIGKRRCEYPSKVENVFNHFFPEIYRFIRKVNREGFEHANLIRELQRAESLLVIGQVCENLRIRYPQMFILTLHDALYSTEENIEIIRCEFERAFLANGFRMSLSYD